MKPYDKDIDIVFSPMSDETMSWLDELLTTCKRFGVDFYNASEKEQRKRDLFGPGTFF